MAWWSDSDKRLELKQKFNFKLFIDAFVFNAKSADRPKVSIEKKEYQLINHKYKYPGIVTWDSVNVTIVDFLNSESLDSKSIWELLKQSGYQVPDGSDGEVTGYELLTTPAKNLFASGTFKAQPVRIVTIDHNGDDVETWELYNPILTKVDWGNHEYGMDEAVEITLTIDYDYAKLV